MSRLTSYNPFEGVLINEEERLLSSKGFVDKDEMEWEMQRYIIESKEKWRKICEQIPSLNFKKEWNVKIIPPFGGALSRFTIDYNGNHVSIYLDWYNCLGYEDVPYWGLYPFKDDTKWYYLEEIEEFMNDIEMILEGEGKCNE